MAQEESSVSHSVLVGASPQEVFDLLADPRKHPIIDGSGTVRGELRAPDRLSEGAKFGMRMKRGVPYRITNRVVEWEENRRIAWRNLLPHRWRYELEPEGAGTLVIETYDYSRVLPGVLSRTRVPTENLNSIKATLHRLKAHFERG
ncbi:SRPBCC family protein [Saccharopolyspora griseoalba]|uniref:SRPBCC family protein n=1 Tax=Saccharopolyspora griseoalba TaxID=1431848 RepID=A0ABW2LLJ6_9PSEU